MKLDFKYIEPVFTALNSTKEPLLTRGESHITVISPPEYAVLSKYGNVTIDDINTIALKHNIQGSVFEVVCLGKEDVVISNVRKLVYQIIVRASNLVKIREAIFKLYVKQVFLATCHCGFQLKRCLP
ncbi:hypothetical protein K501DRAFT_298893 [Backusella circina FSU 941]|nr:hypothetical protein K501DRAFT_298893 [Backusella circina FSU 941]